MNMICWVVLILCFNVAEMTPDLIGMLELVFEGLLTTDDRALETASLDFGRLIQTKPMSVLQPASADDIARLVRYAYSSPKVIPVAARGHGHSIHGQAQVDGGVVVNMIGPSAGQLELGVITSPSGKRDYFVDAWGGELWIDVLKATLEHGLTPRSWTDYLHLTVGGTLSNAGISGQAFCKGPQISNVHELDVVTGKGEIVTCSNIKNSELFHAALGGLGQFGIITRARIALEPAPKMVRWIRVLYSNFSTFTGDQEFLVSLHDRSPSEMFHYIEGFVVVEQSLINNWRSSFFSPANPVKISSLDAGDGPLYCLEMARYYSDSSVDSVDDDVETLLRSLDFLPGTTFTTDLPYVDFLDRVHKQEMKLRSKGLWEVPHPWLNLFVPKSQIEDFDARVFKEILANTSNGPVIIYPMNRNKWDDRNSAVTPDEDIFYLVGLLRSALPSGDATQSLQYLTRQNDEILSFCNKAGIKVKQYLPRYDTEQAWKDHFGTGWDRFLKRKMLFDPNGILGPGQRIFQTSRRSSVLSPA